MALKCTNAFDGAINKEILNDYNKLNSTKKKVYDILGKIDNETTAIGNLPSDAFDGLVNSGSVSIAITNAKDAIDIATGITECVDSLDGDCLGGAIGGLTGLIKDTTGFVSDALNAISDAIDLPTEILNLTQFVSQLRRAFGDGGIDRLLGNILTKLGCVGDKNQQLQDIESDINTIISDFGLNVDGSYNDSTFDSIIDKKLESVANIPSNYKNTVKLNTKRIGQMTNDVQENAKSNLQAVKTNAKKRSGSKVKKTYI